MLVLFTTNTRSIAIVGTSAMRIRRNAFAIAGEMPRISNSTFSASRAVTSTPNRSRKDATLNALSMPTAAYAPLKACSTVCLFSSAPHVTNARWRSSSSFTSSIVDFFDAAPAGFFEPAIETRRRGREKSGGRSRRRSGRPESPFPESLPRALEARPGANTRDRDGG